MKTTVKLSGSTQTVEEFPDTREKSRALRVIFLGAPLVELHQELALALRQFLRGFHNNLNIEVAHIPRAQHRHPLAAQAELLARLGAFGDLDQGIGAAERRNAELAAERR